MSDFVDFGKRGIELPEGCKDLIDVLNLTHRAQSSECSHRRAEKHDALKDYTIQISRLLASKARFKALWIHCDATACVAVFFSDKYGLRTLVLVDSAREAKVRSHFADSGMPPIQDDSLPNNASGLQYALPSASGAKEFFCRLLVECLGATQDSVLEFRYSEKVAK